MVLLYAAEWDSEESARQYFAAYREILRKKWKKMTVDIESADAVTGTGDDGRFELRRKGAIVTSVEGRCRTGGTVRGRFRRALALGRTLGCATLTL